MRWTAVNMTTNCGDPMRQNTRSTEDLRTYLEAHRHAFTWVEEAMVLRSADKIAQATAAVKHVRLWLRVIRELKPQEGPQGDSLAVIRRGRNAAEGRFSI